MPMADMICDAINYLFLDDYGYECAFDFSGISALSQPIAEQAGAVTQFFNMGVPFVELNKRFNLGFSEFENWDLPFNGRDMSAVAMPTTTPTAPKTVKEIDLKPGTINTEKQIEAMRKAAWIKLNDQVNTLIGKTAKQLRGYFRSINQKLLKRVMGMKTVKQITESDIEPLVATLLDDDALEAILAKETEAALIAGASTVQALGDFDIKTMQKE
jgi:hypothetical protein